MAYPAFFDTIPTVTLRDPLARFLGAAEDGLIEYSFAEVVKLTGHSCPTVAGAWLMTVGALKRLYGDDTPIRGEVAVRFQKNAAEGVTGVIAGVVTFLTGATEDTGFKGLRGRFVRRGLMSFDQPIDGDIRFERIDTGQAVTVSFDASQVPSPSDLMPRLFMAMDKEATQEQKAAFAEVWQDRVRRIFEEAEKGRVLKYA